MTIGLSLDTVLSRVQIALSDRSDGTVLVERSTTSGFQKPVTVRGGVALPISGGVGQLDDYEFFVGKTAYIENWYRVAPIDPPAGLLSPGASGDFASTPDAAPLDVTGNIELRALIAAADEWASGSSQTLANKFVGTGNQRSYRLQVTATGGLQLAWSTTGANTLSVNSTAIVDSPTFPLAVRATMDVDDGGGNHVVRFFTAASLAGAWTQLGDAVVNAGTTSIFPGTAPLHIGADGGGNVTFAGVIAAVEVWDGFEGFGGAAVANPVFSDQDNGDTSFADAAGRTWTVNGTAQIVGVDTDSITPTLDGKLWFKSIRYPGQNFAAHRVIDRGGGIGRPARDMLLAIEGRITPTGLMDFHGSRSFVIPLQAADQDATDRLDLVLAVGREWFIHVPPELHGKVPGGYVSIGMTSQQRPTTQDKWVFTLPCTEISPPGPDVVGTTLTGDQLVAMHGDANSVWAAYPTIQDLWDTVGPIEDLVI